MFCHCCRGAPVGDRLAVIASVGRRQRQRTHASKQRPGPHRTPPFRVLVLRPPPNPPAPAIRQLLSWLRDADQSLARSLPHLEDVTAIPGVVRLHWLIGGVTSVVVANWGRHSVTSQ